MKTFVRAVILTMLILAGACSKSGGDKDKSPVTKEEPAKNEGGGHAAKDVVPGSHEDWCGEHEVPESQCTRCDPSLIAAFKAIGDWSEEHGLPASHCNPDLKIVRPPKK